MSIKRGSLQAPPCAPTSLVATHPAGAKFSDIVPPQRPTTPAQRIFKNFSQILSKNSYLRNYIYGEKCAGPYPGLQKLKNTNPAGPKPRPTPASPGPPACSFPKPQFLQASTPRTPQVCRPSGLQKLRFCNFTGPPPTSQLNPSLQNPSFSISAGHPTPNNKENT